MWWLIHHLKFVGPCLCVYIIFWVSLYKVILNVIYFIILDFFPMCSKTKLCQFSLSTLPALQSNLNPLNKIVFASHEVNNILGTHDINLIKMSVATQLISVLFSWSCLLFSLLCSALSYNFILLLCQWTVAEPCIMWVAQCHSHLTHNSNNGDWPQATTPINHLYLLFKPLAAFFSPSSVQFELTLHDLKKKALVLLLHKRVKNSGWPFHMAASINLMEIITPQTQKAMSRFPYPPFSFNVFQPYYTQTEGELWCMNGESCS